MNLEDWRDTYARHSNFCDDFFGGRAEHIKAQAKMVVSLTRMGEIQALDLCMQIEAEFGGRVEEFVGRAMQHPSGFLHGLQNYIVHVRTFGG